MLNVLSFYKEVPEEIIVNRNWTCRPSEPENAWKKPYLIQPATVESVHDALARGPFVGISSVGPRCYSVEPSRFDGQISTYPDVTVYGWKIGAERISNSIHVPIIICGVQRKAEKEHLYYVLAEDISQNPEEAIGKFAPLSTDRKVYVASMKTFARFEFDMFPPVSQQEFEQNKDQLVVPTPLAGQPDLIELWKQGKITISQI